MNDFHKTQISFSISQESFFNQLVTKATITNLEGNKSKSGEVLWDTGATLTVINKKLLDNLNLPIEIVKPFKMANRTEVPTPIAIVDIILPGNISIPKHKVGSFNTGNYLAIIGMDIIGSGSLSINYDKETKKSTFDFSINPSICIMRNFHSKDLIE